MKKKIDKVKQGKNNRASGSTFELTVRKDLESKYWFVLKNPNNVIGEKFKQGKSKYNPITKRLMMGSGGFPDFICFGLELEVVHKHLNGALIENKTLYELVGVEAKSNGYLDKIEKEKCKWLLKNKIFSKILVASKDKKGKGIIYKEF